MGIGMYSQGALRSRLVARLSGASASQLGRWHRSELIAATVLPGGRGRRRLYSWIEYSKTRAAVKLLEQGLRRQRLRPNLERLDQEIEDWYLLPLLAFRSHVIVPLNEGRGYTIMEKQGVMRDFVKAADCARVQVQPGEIEHAIQVVQELQAEGPLGKLNDFDECVTMDPSINQGAPILIGTRLETAHIAAIHEKGRETIGQIADRYDLSTRQVESAVNFERVLAA